MGAGGVDKKRKVMLMRMLEKCVLLCLVLTHIHVYMYV